MPYLNPKAIDYLTERVEINHKTGCWEWIRSIGSHGYGAAHYSGRYYLAHRLSYRTLVGEIPKGIQIDHRCRNKRCVNPDHLEAVTQAENIHRQFETGFEYRTQCRYGHGADNYVRNRAGYGVCRVCQTAAVKRHRERKRERQAA